MSVPNILERDTAKPASGYRYAVEDIIGGLKRWELWLNLGYQDIRQRYRRSTVGPFWLTISMGMMIGGLAYLYAGLFGQSVEEYLPYVAAGMIVFNMISTIATEGCHAFVSSGNVILQTRAPFSIYVFQMLWRNVLILAHNMVIYLLLLLVLPINIGLVTLLVVPGLFLVLLAGFTTSLFFGALSTRFRDVPPIIGSVMQVAFFLSPVFWTPGVLRGREIFVNANPFYYMLEIVRMPLLGKAPPLSMWGIAILINCFCALVALAFFARYRHRIPYWI